MAQESKQWVNVVHRSSKLKSGGVFVYVPSELLELSNIPTNKPLQVRRYATREGKIILKFRVVKE